MPSICLIGRTTLPIGASYARGEGDLGKDFGSADKALEWMASWIGLNIFFIGFRESLISRSPLSKSFEYLSELPSLRFASSRSRCNLQKLSAPL